MDRLDYVMMMLERTLGTRTKRHILGGALVSVSLMLSGLAITVMTLKTDEENKDDNEIQII